MAVRQAHERAGLAQRQLHLGERPFSSAPTLAMWLLTSVMSDIGAVEPEHFAAPVRRG